MSEMDKRIKSKEEFNLIEKRTELLVSRLAKELRKLQKKTYKALSEQDEVSMMTKFSQDRTESMY
jgi:hypothetical protein